MLLENTFHPCEHTWTGATGRNHRIDYILTSSEVHECVQNCDVDRSIPLNNAARDDHFIGAMRFALSGRRSTEPPGPRRPAKAVKVDKAKLGDPAVIDRIQTACCTFPRASIDCNIDEYVDALSKFLSVQLSSVKQSGSRPRKSWLQKETWHQIEQSHVAKRSLSLAKQLLPLYRVCSLFLHWLSTKPTLFCKHHNFQDLNDVRLEVKHASATIESLSSVFNRAKNLSQKMIKKDKAAHVELVLAKASKAAANGDTRALFKAADSFSKYAPPKIKSVMAEDGHLTCTAREYGQAFAKHFVMFFEPAW